MAGESALLARIEKLEASYRTLRLIAIVPLLFLCVLLLSGQARNRQTIEAQEFVLKDSAGNVVGRMAVGKGGPYLELIGKSKVAAAMLLAGDEVGSAIMLTNHHGGTRILLSSDATLEGERLDAGLFVGDGTNVLGAKLGGAPNIVLSRGQESGVVVSTQAPGPFITLTGKKQKVLWTTP